MRGDIGMADKELRKSPREPIAGEVVVNYGSPSRGGFLIDISSSGAAILYPPVTVSTNEPITVGQLLILNFHGVAKMPGRVARTFEGGFATKFDLPVRNAD